MAYISTFSGQSSASLTTSVTFTVPPTADYAIVSCAMRGGDGAATTLTSVTMGGASFTLDAVNYRRFDSYQAVEAGYMLLAQLPSGSVTATATRGTATNGFTISVSFFSGVDQVAPAAANSGSGTGGDPFETSIVIGADSDIVDIIATSNNGSTFTTNQAGQALESNENVAGESLQSWSSILAGLTGTVTMGWATGANTQRTSHVVLALTSAASNQASIDFYLSTAESTTATVKCRVSSGNSTAMEYSVNSDFSASSTSSAVIPVVGNDFVAEFSLTGLTANSQYYYRAIEDGATDSRNGKFKTMSPAGTAQNIKFAFSGDASVGNNSQSFANVAALTDIDFFMHMGDLHYEDITTNTEAAYFTGYKTVFSQSNQRALYENHALNYKWDDHDYGANDSTGSSATKVSAAAAYRKYIPSHGLNNTSSGSIEEAWTHGRVRFIMLDTRYERGGGSLLGATQKAWFLAELASIAADPNIAFTVVSAGVPWIATGVTDTWSDAAAERTEIADQIFAQGLENSIVFVCADAHMIAFDDGTNNTFDTSNQTGWPVYHSAPMGRAGSIKGGPYSGTVFQGDVDGQYSTMQITDTGTQITVLVTGLDKNQATLYTNTFSFTTNAAQANFPVQGSNATGLTYKVFDSQNLATANEIAAGTTAAIVSNTVTIDLAGVASVGDNVLLVLTDFITNPSAASQASISYVTVTGA